MFYRPIRSGDPGSMFIMIGRNKVPYVFLRGYYQTGLRASLKDHAEVSLINSWIDIALSTIWREQKQWSEGELRKHFWDVFFITSKFSVEFDIDFIDHQRLLLDKLYDHIWGMSMSFKMAFAKTFDAPENQGLIKALKDYEGFQRVIGDIESADLAGVIIEDIKSFYAGEN